MPDFRPLPRLAVVAVAVLVHTAAAGQTWPTKPIRWILPFPPGGSTDIAVRPVADRLSQVFGQSIVVENRTGAAGNIGTEFVAKSAPDGYTVLAAVDSIAMAPHVYPKLGFDPLKDFEFVTQLARQPVVLAAHPSLNVATVAELVQLAKAKPGLAFATSGAGTQQHLAGEWFARLAGIQLTHIPYKGGGQAITDFVAGQVPLASLGSSPLIPHYKSGKVKLLAQTTTRRAPALPDVPTYEEAGFKGLVVEQWLGVFLPAGTPGEVVARLNAEIVKALADSGIRERYAAAALEPVGNTPAQFAQVVRDDHAKYGRLVRELGIKVD
jgi:tripartite-type tricarboxylate transporter receptor subunit TctC